ncbi:hypothetical protein GCM10011414_18660 [Croceivirga lutea]|uniref:DUF2752 domain-containing protein n=1 Tax=Croceivirga lutea TaxID=1775167 RepID=UPI0019BF1CFF|nr:DUF2752 domain-containing protein [Croceivirga lutea]GGG49118.1 hypothetical protein GCM10011414_18660 [Croceivirga lutea]
MKVKLLILLLSLDNYMLPCLNKRLFGFDCPGCGLQRSVAMLIKGDFLGALHMYPAIYPIILLLSFLIFDSFFELKSALTIKIILSLIVGITIISSYIFKITHLFH